MPFALIIVGIVVLIAAVRGTQGTLGHLLAHDFFGPNSFVWWAVACIIVGSIGYVPKLKSFSIAFLSLILIAMLVGHSGFFSQFVTQLQQSGSQPAAAPNQDVSSGWGSLAGTGGSSSGASGALGAVSSLAAPLAAIGGV